MFLAFATHSNFKVYQVYVKSAILNVELEEKVYMEQPSGFEDPEFADFVYFLFKALYGLKQAPHTWYGTLSEFLLENGFTRGVIDKTLFYKMHKHDMILVQFYVDDIIFGSTNDQLCSRFAKLMQSMYEMSMMEELNYFLGLQVSQRNDGIFICQSKYVRDLLKKYGLEDASTSKTPTATTTKLNQHDQGKCVDIAIGNRAWQRSKKKNRFPPKIHANICVYITRSIGRTNLLSLSNGRYGGPAQHVSRLRDLRL